MKLALFCTAALASTTLRPPLASSSPSGHRTIALASPSSYSFTRKGELGAGVQVLWNLTDVVVGKVTSISLSAQANAVVTGTTYTPVTQVSSIALDSGKLLSKATPDSQFSYSTAIAGDGSRTAVYGCAVQQGKDCSLSVFKGTDVSATPVWKEKIKGYQYWGAQGMKMSADGTLVAVGALKSLPQTFSLVPAVLSWYTGTGQLIGNYSMALSLGEVWASNKFVASRDFTGSTGYLRIFNPQSLSSNCSLEADYDALIVSPTLATVIQPYQDAQQIIYAKQQSGGQQCVDNWQWPMPGTKAVLVAVGTSDVASAVATLVNVTITISIFRKSSNADPPQPASFSVDLPADYPLAFSSGDVHFAFSTDGVHLGISIAGLGIYYVNVDTAPSSPLHVFTDDNACGILSMAVEPSSTGDVFLVVDFNQLVSVSPEELDCMEGGDGLAAFKISK